MKVTFAELRDTAEKAIIKYGYDAAETAAILEVLLYAQIRGNNQGVVKLIGTGIPKPATASEMEVVKDTTVTAFIDAHQQHPMLVISKAADIVAAKAAEHGIAVVGVHGIAASSGALGVYARNIAKKGLVGIVLASSPETVAAAGSFQAIFGTNPFAIAVPTSEKPLVLDMATAAMAYYGVIEANTAGRELPKDIAYDKNGKLTTSPAEVMDNGALRTFDKDGYKGSHLSFMVQILAGPLVGGAFMSEGDTDNNGGGHLLIAINPEMLGGLEHTRQSVSLMMQKVKATKKLPGVDQIVLAGEHGDARAEEVEKTGQVEIEENLWAELKKAAGM